MVVSHASIMDFRNFTSLRLGLGQGVNILCGANAQGKTNFLEALYFCATGRSRRTGYDRELIRFQAQEAHLQVKIESSGLDNRIDAQLRKDGPKGFAVNGLPVRRLGDLFGVMLVVMFSPEDLQLVKSGPAERRRFYDMELCQLSPVYYYDLQQYHRILKQRNVLLKRLQKEKNNDLRESLFAWDEQLAAYGGKIIAQRRRFSDHIGRLANEVHRGITSDAEEFCVIYKPNVGETEFADKLRRNVDRDILLGTTGVGVHKDDALFFINGLDARLYGSQGQQRTASLSLKLAELALIKEDKNESPVLLLDDVFSELDAERQKCLLQSISGVQTILTCTGVEDILREYEQQGDTRLFVVDAGQIVERKV